MIGQHPSLKRVSECYSLLGDVKDKGSCGPSAIWFPSMAPKRNAPSMVVVEKHIRPKAIMQRGPGMIQLEGLWEIRSSGTWKSPSLM